MLHFVSPALEASGYGIAGRDYLLSFHECGHNVTFTPTFFYSKFNPDFIDEDDFKILLSMKRDSLLELDKNIPCILHNTPAGSKISSYMKRTILYTTWETNRLPFGVEKLLDQFDLVLTPSEFSKACFVNSGVKSRVKVVPHVIRQKKVSSSPKFIAKINNILFNDNFIFLSIFDFHLGKGYDLLLDAYYKTFSDKDNVLLLIKTTDFSKLDSANSIKNKILSFRGKSTARVVVITEILRDNEIMSLHNLSDCYVSPTRREAWGINFAEALSFGKTVIAPSIGGHREFINDSNALLISSKQAIIDKVEPSRMDYKGQTWVNSDVDHLSSLMRMVYEKGKIKTDRNRYKETMEKFSSSRVVDVFRKAVGV